MNSVAIIGQTTAILITGNTCPVIGSASLGPPRTDDWEVRSGDGTLLAYNHFSGGGGFSPSGWNTSYSGDTPGDNSNTLSIVVPSGLSPGTDYTACIIRRNSDSSLSCFSTTFDIALPASSIPIPTLTAFAELVAGVPSIVLQGH